MKSTRILVIVVLGACGGAGSSSPAAAPLLEAAPVAAADNTTDTSPEATSKYAAETASVKPGINERFLDPNMDVEHWKKIFEGESREIFASRVAIVDALGLAPGMRVADIGAGTGLFLRAFSEVVGPRGRVYPVDISPRFLDHLRKRAKAEGLANVEVVTGGEKSVALSPGSVELVFTCDTYHHFEYPAATLESIRSALAPGGTLVVVDFERIEGKTRPWALQHVRAGKDVFRSEIEKAGFRLEAEVKVPGLHENYMLRFRKIR